MANNTTNKGNNNPARKISEDDVLHIHDLYSSGISQTKIAKMYEISSKHVNAIINFRQWEHLRDKVKGNSSILDKKTPFIINGGDFVDDRGVLRFFNNFSFYKIRRFYCITHTSLNTIRAWHGHNQEGKIFFVNSGSFLIGAVDMNTEKCNKYVLSDRGQSKMLWIPPGYANGFMNLTTDGVVTIFSTSTVDESKDDDIRFDYNKWNIWNIDYR